MKSVNYPPGEKHIQSKPLCSWQFVTWLLCDRHQQPHKYPLSHVCKYGQDKQFICNSERIYYRVTIFKWPCNTPLSLSLWRGHSGVWVGGGRGDCQGGKTGDRSLGGEENLKETKATGCPKERNSSQCVSSLCISFFLRLSFHGLSNQPRK